LISAQLPLNKLIKIPTRHSRNAKKIRSQSPELEAFPHAPLYSADLTCLADPMRQFRHLLDLSDADLVSMSPVQQCPSFKCKPGATSCCCRRALYTQPDFVAVESLLKAHCQSRNFGVLFLPKFHCELNFIEQCWGYAKCKYHKFPPSSKEANLEKNLLASLGMVSLVSMRKYVCHAQWFMHAYQEGLDGKDAAWACKKYRGHKVIPSFLLANLDKPNA
jgi:hypothetical protein